MPKAVLLNDTSHMLHAGSRLASRNIVQLLSSKGIEVIYTTPHGQMFQEAWADTVRRLRPDVIVVHGEGGIHSSAKRPWVGRLLQAALDLKAELNVPLALINSIADTLEPEVLTILAEFDVINVRETRSQAYLAEKDIEAAAVPDFSLSRPFSASAHSRQGGIVIDSVVAEASIELQQTAQALDWHWLSMQPPLTRGRFPRVQKALRKLGAEQLPFVKSKSDPDRVLNFLAGHAQAVTGRFHGQMFCLLTHTPFFGIESNTHKITSSCIDVFGNAERVKSLQDLRNAASTASGAAPVVPPFSDAEAQAVTAYLDRCAKGAQQVIDRIAKLV